MKENKKRKYTHTKEEEEEDEKETVQCKLQKKKCISKWVQNKEEEKKNIKK